MPTEPYTGSELEESRLLLNIVDALFDGDEDDQDVAEMLLLNAVEPLQRQLFQDIGPEKLSLARLRREALASGRDADAASVTTYIKFGFCLQWFEEVVA